MNRMREIISIHVPNAGNDGLSGMANYIVKEFQSTFPMQGTTNRVQRLILRQGISIHVPNAGNDSTGSRTRHCTSISIHVPNAGNDHYRAGKKTGQEISIHVPNAGNDVSRRWRQQSSRHFNPRSQCRERRQRRSRMTH